MVVAAIGLIVNIICALVLHDKSGHDDYNRHSAYLHVLADALTSIGAIFGLICAMIWNITWIDCRTDLFSRDHPLGNQDAFRHQQNFDHQRENEIIADTSRQRSKGSISGVIISQ